MLRKGFTRWPWELVVSGSIFNLGRKCHTSLTIFTGLSSESRFISDASVKSGVPWALYFYWHFIPFTQTLSSALMAFRNWRLVFILGSWYFLKKYVSTNSYLAFFSSSRLNDAVWLVSLPLSLQTDTRICALPSSWFPLCTAPEPPWFAPPEKKMLKKCHLGRVHSSFKGHSRDPTSENTIRTYKWSTHGFDRLDSLLASRCCLSLNLSRNLQKQQVKATLTHIEHKCTIQLKHVGNVENWDLTTGTSPLAKLSSNSASRSCQDGKKKKL